MKILIFILLTILSLNLLSASCNSTQININEASLEELDELYRIGPAKAQAIIDTRPFESIDDLINVSGIGEITLNNILDQGLACVGESIEEEEPPEEPPPEEHPPEEEEAVPESVSSEEGKEETEEQKPSKSSLYEPKEPIIIKQKQPPLETIKLNPKTIKTLDSKEESGKNNYTKYSIFVFCILLLFLYKIKPRQKKNEWQ